MLRWFAGSVRDVLAAEADAARVGHLEARDHAQRRRLAAARRTEQRQELAGRDVEAHVARRVDLALDAMREALGDAVDVDRRSVGHAPLILPAELVHPAPAPGARKQAQHAADQPRSRRTRRRRRTPRTPRPGRARARSCSRGSCTVISVQPIDTRKIVALIAVIERMNTTPRPAKNAGSDQRQRDAPERRRRSPRPGPARLPRGSGRSAAAAPPSRGCRSGRSGTRSRR